MRIVKSTSLWRVFFPLLGCLVLSGLSSSRAMTPPKIAYRIDVRLDHKTRILTGNEAVSYTSHAGRSLNEIYFHLYPNAFRGAESSFSRKAERIMENYTGRFTPEKDLGYTEVESLLVNGVPARFEVDETIMKVTLEEPLRPGVKLDIRMKFKVKIPKVVERFGFSGSQYSMCQWYPRVAAYDEKGWHPYQYDPLAEFFGDFATFDVTIALPDRFYVGATGELVSAEGGDNEIPLAFPEKVSGGETPVEFEVEVPAGTDQVYLTGDSEALGKWKPKAKKMKKVTETRFRLDLPLKENVPVHYRYTRGSRKNEEIEPDGAAGVYRLVIPSKSAKVRDKVAAWKDSAKGEPEKVSYKTLHYHAERVHDFAWVASPAYVRDDTVANGVLVRALMYKKHAKKEGWKDFAFFGARALDFLESYVGEYPYPVFTITEASQGFGGAMEYPTLIMNDPGVNIKWTRLLDEVTAHEMGHNWFYGMLASDERKEPWLDEGFATLVEWKYMQRYYGENGNLVNLPSWFPLKPELSTRALAELTYINMVWLGREEPIVTPADKISSQFADNVAYYSKTPWMLYMLEYVIGKDAFEKFLHTYFDRYKFTHPHAEDVIRTAEEASGRDLSWFFDEWLYTTKTCNYAVGKMVKEEPSPGSFTCKVPVYRQGEIDMPVEVEAELKNGEKVRKRVRLESDAAWVDFRTSSEVRKVRLDPDHRLLETNRLDNATGIIPPVRFSFLYRPPTAEAYDVLYGPSIWYNDVDGMKLGAWLNGGYLSEALPTPTGGDHRFKAGVSLGLKTKKVHSSFSYSHPLVRGTSRVLLKLAGGDKEGESYFSAGLRIRLAKTIILHPRHYIDLYVAGRNRYDMDYVRENQWEKGKLYGLFMNWYLTTRNPWLRGRYNWGGAISPQIIDSDYRFGRVYASINNDLRFPALPWLRMKIRGFAGFAGGEVPLQYAFNAASGNVAAATGKFYLNEKGPFRRSEHFRFEGEGTLRGYFDRGLLAKQVETGSFQFSISKAGLDQLTFFFDAGEVRTMRARALPDPELRHELEKKLLADAGIELSLGPARVSFPFWLSHPREGEEKLDFRWSVALGTAF